MVSALWPAELEPLLAIPTVKRCTDELGLVDIDSCFKMDASMREPLETAVAAATKTQQLAARPLIAELWARVELFQSWDEDGGGALDYAEVDKAIKRAFSSEMCKLLLGGHSSLREKFAAIDTNGDCLLSFGEFFAVCSDDRRFYGLLKNEAVQPLIDHAQDKFHSTRSGRMHGGIHDGSHVSYDVLLETRGAQGASFFYGVDLAHQTELPLSYADISQDGPYLKIVVNEAVHPSAEHNGGQPLSFHCLSDEGAADWVAAVSMAAREAEEQCWGVSRGFLAEEYEIWTYESLRDEETLYEYSARLHERKGKDRGGRQQQQQQLACPYIHKIATESIGRKRKVGKATVFVSHAYAMTAKEFFTICLSALEDHDYAWISLFATQNPSCGARGSEFWAGQIENVMKSIGRVVAVMSPWMEPAPLRRIWCLYELACAIRLGLSSRPGKLRAFLSRDQTAQLRVAVISEPLGSFEKLRGGLIDVQRAEAAEPGDKQALLCLLQEPEGGGGGGRGGGGGCLQAEVDVALWMRDWALGLLQQLVNESAEALKEGRSAAEEADQTATLRKAFKSKFLSGKSREKQAASSSSSRGAQADGGKGDNGNFATLEDITGALNGDALRAEIWLRLRDADGDGRVSMDEYVAFELKHAPSLEHASLCGAVGMIFLRQGIATRTSASGALAGGGAVELLGEEFSIVHKVLGDRHPTTARAYLRLADAYVLQGLELERPLELYATGLALQEELGVAQDKAAVSDTHLQIAAVHGKRGDTSAMLRYFESALSLRDEAMASHHTQTALIYNGIGNVRLSQGKHATAIDAFSKALEIDEELRGASDRRTADANLHLASAFHQRADATADVGQAMALRKKSASFYVRACRVLDAIAEALLEPRQEPPPPPPPLQLPLSAARAAAHSGLAVVRQQLGELNEALEEYLLALEIFTSYIDVHVTQRLQQPSTQAAAAAAADPSSPSPSLPLSAAAAAAAAATAVSETPAVTVMSSDGSRNLSSVITVAETHLEIARIYIALGSEQVEQLGPHSVAERKLLRGAVQHYRLAVGVFEAEHGLQHEITANVLYEMACGYQKQGDRTNAKECFERAAASCLSVAAAREENGDLEAAVVFYRKSAFGYEEARGHALGECERALRHAIVCEERLEEAAREKALQALQSDVAAPPSLQPVPDADSSEISAATLGSPQRERKVLDDTSVESAVSYNDVALVYYEQGEPAVALRLFAKALKIFEAAADDTSKAVQKNAGVDSGDGDVSARQIADSYYNMAIACAELQRVITAGGVDDDAARAEEQQELLAAVIASLAASGSEDAADMSAWGGAGPAALAATAAALCYRRAASVYRGALGAHAEETVEAVRGAQWAEAAALDAATTRA